MLNKIIKEAKRKLKELNPHIKRVSVKEWRIVNHGTRAFTVSVRLLAQRGAYDVWVTCNIEDGTIAASFHN